MNKPLASIENHAQDAYNRVEDAQRAINRHAELNNDMDSELYSAVVELANIKLSLMIILEQIKNERPA